MLDSLNKLSNFLNSQGLISYSNQINQLIKNSMFIKGDPDGDYIIAYKDSIWRVPGWVDEIDEKIRQEINSSLNIDDDDLEWFTFSDFVEFINDTYRINVFVGEIRNNSLFVYEVAGFVKDPKSSIIVKKIVKELGLSGAHYYSYGDEEEHDVHKREMKGEVAGPFYHGTCTGNLKEILRVGLIPGRAGSNFREITHPNYIFFTSRIDKARFHATNAAEKTKSEPVIIELRIPNQNLIIQDYDIDSASGYKSDLFSNISVPGLGAYIGGDSTEEGYKLEETPMALSREYGIYGYNGRIPLSFIDKIYIAMNSDEYDSFYGIDLEYTDVTKDEANMYIETKEEFGHGYLEYPEFEDDEEEEW